MHYAGQRALVVGASGAIGAAIARELIDNGADVALTFNMRRQGIQDLIERAASRAQRCYAYSLDLRDPEAVSARVRDVAKELGVPSIVACCAGLTRDRPLAKMELDDWKDVIESNLSGNFYLLRAVAPMMMKHGGGRVVQLASVSGMFGQAGQANYAAAKGGLIAMTRALARELGPFRITVNAIAPGLIETEMTSQMSDGLRRRFLERIPLRRLGTPLDVVPVARLLMAPDGAYVTGQVLVVDGGLSS
jgi:3-oxoacyl-[acyl-carrier protein] reductase